MAKKILIVQTAFLGDLLLSIPLIKSVKNNLPGAEINLVCRKGFGSFFKNSGLVADIFEIQKKNSDSYQSVIDANKGTTYDLILCPHESFTTARLISKIKAHKKIGFKKWWNFFFFTETVKKDYLLPDALRQMSLLMSSDPLLSEKLVKYKKFEKDWTSDKNLLPEVPDWAKPTWSWPWKQEDVAGKFRLPENYVCLFPGSVWKTKQWVEEGFIEVGRALRDKNVTVIVMGGPGEEKLAEFVAKEIPGAFSLAGKTSLQESVMILSKAQVVVTNDSAGQHLAALVEAPTASVFGPTVLEFGFRPWNSNAIVVERKNLACRPCGKHGHHKCPIGTHECMKGLSYKEVLSATEKLLQL